MSTYYAEDRRPGPKVGVGRAARAHARPVHLRWQYLALVAAGGAVGTALRELLMLAVPPVAEIPVATLGINVLGAFLLGALLETLARRGPDVGGRRKLRLLLGTGALGGFTTYSSLATDTSLLIIRGHLGVSLPQTRRGRWSAPLPPGPASPRRQRFGAGGG